MILLDQSEIFKIMQKSMKKNKIQDIEFSVIIIQETLAYITQNIIADMETQDICDSVFAVFDFYNYFIDKNKLKLVKIDDESYQTTITMLNQAIDTINGDV